MDICIAPAWRKKSSTNSPSTHHASHPQPVRPITTHSPVRFNIIHPTNQQISRGLKGQLPRHRGMQPSKLDNLPPCQRLSVSIPRRSASLQFPSFQAIDQHLSVSGFSGFRIFRFSGFRASLFFSALLFHLLASPRPPYFSAAAAEHETDTHAKGRKRKEIRKRGRMKKKKKERKKESK